VTGTPADDVLFPRAKTVSTTSVGCNAYDVFSSTSRGKSVGKKKVEKRATISKTSELPSTNVVGEFQNPLFAGRATSPRNEVIV
jgi:hypothetical protein